MCTCNVHLLGEFRAQIIFYMIPGEGQRNKENAYIVEIELDLIGNSYWK